MDVLMVKYLEIHSPVALRQLAEVEQEPVYMYVVYAVYNRKVNKMYIGQTENLIERSRFHNEKTFKNSYTSRFDGEWILIYKEEVLDRKQALIRERQLKSFRGREFVKKYIPL